MAEPGTPPVIGVIGGSGVSDMDGLSNPRSACFAKDWKRLARLPS